jgi:hypothetical protein
MLIARCDGLLAINEVIYNASDHKIGSYDPAESRPMDNPFAVHKVYCECQGSDDDNEESC